MNYMPSNNDPAAAVRALSDNLGDLFEHTARCEASGDIASAMTLYQAWIAKNPAHPLLHAAYFNYAVALSKAGDRYAAVNALRACLAIKPDFHPAHINLGRLLEDDGQAGAAVTQWMTLVSQTGMIEGNAVKHKLIALQQIGRVLETFQQDDPAEDALRQSLEIDDSQPEIVQHWIALRQRQCKWPVIAPTEHVSAETLYRYISPLSLGVASNDPMFQLARAFKYSRELTGAPRVPLCRPGVAKKRSALRNKLRIGYVSSDLREHAVGFAMADVLETHDRNAFEITAYYCGIDRPDGIQSRARQNVDHWTDISRLDDEAAARRIHDDGIDILVDLNGYTKDARSRVFSYRPAPVTVNWFGYPGTMGSSHHHYIIADPIIIPEEDEIFYSERVLRLPCYQPNDRKRVVASEVPSREEVGLPAGQFVYCCLNGSQKITPQVFQNWLHILREVPDSVLWLLTGGAAADTRLREIAAAHGVDPERIVPAEKMPNPQHLARYQLADLFLDSPPYGAHTTASDAMWMGVPVLTYPGRTFASRVCASLVHAAGLGDFVCDSEPAYVARAIELGRNPAEADALKARLIAQRSRAKLFDTAGLVSKLEDLFRVMWADAVAGRLPKPDLTNMQDYFDIGLALAARERHFASLEELLGEYRSKLDEWADSVVMSKDSRLQRP